jgi:hypothetical protein
MFGSSLPLVVCRRTHVLFGLLINKYNFACIMEGNKPASHRLLALRSEALTNCMDNKYVENLLMRAFCEKCNVINRIYSKIT